MTDTINSHSRRMYNAEKKTSADPATPLDDPRVKALVEATKNLTDIAHKHTFGKAGILDVHAAVKNTRAALSALEENK